MEIWLYVAERNRTAADRLKAQFSLAYGRLIDNPFIGRERTDLRPGYRSWTVQNYLIFYEVSDSLVSIARVLHGTRDLEEIFAVE